MSLPLGLLSIYNSCSFVCNSLQCRMVWSLYMLLVFVGHLIHSLYTVRCLFESHQGQCELKLLCRPRLNGKWERFPSTSACLSSCHEHIAGMKLEILWIVSGIHQSMRVESCYLNLRDIEMRLLCMISHMNGIKGCVLCRSLVLHLLAPSFHGRCLACDEWQISILSLSWQLFLGKCCIKWFASVALRQSKKASAGQWVFPFLTSICIYHDRQSDTRPMQQSDQVIEMKISLSLLGVLFNKVKSRRF